MPPRWLRVGTVKDPEPAKSEDSNPANQTEQLTENTDSTAAGADTTSAPSRLPVEPALAWETETPGDAEQGEDDGHEADATFAELRRFCLYGNVGSEPVTHASESWPTPALIARFKDLSNIRYDYPLCLTGGDRETPAKTLTAIVDEVISAVADSSDEGQRLTRHLYQLEAKVKELAEKKPGTGLSILWNQAADDIVAATRLVVDEKQMLKQDMNVARGALRSDGEVLVCDKTTSRRLFEAAVQLQWRKHCTAWRQDLDMLIFELREILAADFIHSPEAKSPEHLKASVGSGDEEELDFQAMSSILKESDLGDPIPESRRKRITGALEVIDRIKPLFDITKVTSHKGKSKKTNQPLQIEIIENDCAAVFTRYNEQMKTLVEFFKAVEIARLEVANRYHEQIHDAFFDHFDLAHLTSTEVELCPPILLVLTGEFFANRDKGQLFDVLASEIPVKILVQLDSLLDSERTSESADIIFGWQTRLAKMVMALDDIYVLQCPVSNAPLLQKSLMEGLSYSGPAVFCVFEGNRDDQPGLTTFHCGATATESRVFPVFTYDPGKGRTLYDRTSVSDNPRIDHEWSVDAFSYQNANGDEKSIDLAFTPADFLFGDIRLSQHFWRVPADKWHKDMIPVDEYLKLDADTAETRIPYIAGVGTDGRISRIVVTRAVLGAVESCGSFWRNIQENGGVNNSFVDDALSGEKQKLEDNKQTEVDAIKKKFDSQLGRNIGELTREVVQRIVNQIVYGGGIGMDAPLAPTTPAPAPSTDSTDTTDAPAAPEVETEEEEDEAISFDEPYIDTPLCTTCNECTNLNGKMFAYNENKQAFVKDASAGTFRELVTAAEKCPVHIIHPGKPGNPDETGLDDLVQRAAKFN